MRRYLPAFLFAQLLGLVACDALKPHETDAGVPVAVATAVPTVAATATATATDTTAAAAPLGGPTTPVAPGQPAPKPVAKTDGGKPAPAPAPAAPAFALPGFDAGALRLPTGFDAGGFHF